jgi:hypothetical protein
MSALVSFIKQKEQSMSVYTLDLSIATCDSLLAALKELAENWTKEKGLAHTYSEGVLFGEIRKRIKDLKCGDYEILDVNGVYIVRSVAS